MNLLLSPPLKDETGETNTLLLLLAFKNPEFFYNKIIEIDKIRDRNGYPLEYLSSDEIFENSWKFYEKSSFLFHDYEENIYEGRNLFSFLEIYEYFFY